ncbi:hypothetical protein C477_14368 [Haloterrigena salina JCM 13891]|uniref:Uncharacterized protein n=1 Tax=Haloterrigena salina JCM 13891 TaxID=1227488 RepID=M0C0R7_9EURY|nr:hypothetical protein C477_14368 [Haloterrigena salina JCM 13891]
MRLGDHPALLAGEVITLENDPGCGNERVDIFAGERDRVAPITVVESSSFLNRVESPFVPVVCPDPESKRRSR